MFENKESKKKGMFEAITGIFSKGKDEKSGEYKQELSKKVLRDVEDKYAFDIGGGRKLCSLKELAIFLKTLNDDISKKYVDSEGEKNDFALWVSSTIGDDVLGEQLIKQKGVEEMAKLVDSRIRELKPYLGKVKGKVEGEGEGGKVVVGEQNSEKNEEEIKEKKDNDSGGEKENIEEEKSGEKSDEKSKDVDTNEGGDKEANNPDSDEKSKDVDANEGGEKDANNPDSDGKSKDVDKDANNPDSDEKSKDVDANEGGEKDANNPDSDGKSEDVDKEEKKPDGKKSVSELLEEEGVFATEAESGDDSDEKEDLANLNDMYIAIEKIEGKLEMMDQFRQSSDERVGGVSERVGELRQMLIDKERSFNEVQSKFEKISDSISDMKPEKITKQLKNAHIELEKRDSKIEILEVKVDAFSKEILGYRKTMSQIKDFENMINVLNKLKEEVAKIDDNRNYSEKMSAKSEYLFAELNEKLSDFRGYLAKIESTDDITQDLLKSVDEMKTKQDKFVSGDDLDKFRGQMQQKEFGATKNDFMDAIKEVEKEILGLKDKLETVEFKTKSVSELMEEKSRVEKFVEKINADYKNKQISGEAHLESTGKSRSRLGEIESSLERLDKELLYGEMSRVTKLVNDNIVKIDKSVLSSDFDKLSGTVVGLRHKLDSSNFEKAISNLEDAKTNIYGRVSQTEKTVFELDLRLKQTQSSLEKLQVLKDSYSEFEDLISENVSEIDRIKSVLSGMENKIDGDLAPKVSRVESLFDQQQEDIDRKIEQVEKQINLVVDGKLKTIDSFSKEIDALKEGKSLVYDKFSSFSNNIDSINLTLSDLKDRLMKLDPKVSSLENTIQGDISPAVTSIRSKISEMDVLKTGLELLKNKMSESSQGKFTDRVKILDKQIRQIRRDVYGGD